MVRCVGGSGGWGGKRARLGSRNRPCEVRACMCTLLTHGGRTKIIAITSQPGIRRRRHRQPDPGRQADDRLVRFVPPQSIKIQCQSGLRRSCVCPRGSKAHALGSIDRSGLDVVDGSGRRPLLLGFRRVGYDARPHLSIEFAGLELDWASFQRTTRSLYAPIILGGLKQPAAKPKAKQSGPTTRIRPNPCGPCAPKSFRSLVTLFQGFQL